MAKARADGKTKTGQQQADKARRRTEGDERNLSWSKLTATQKLASLDSRLGPSQGAKRQRAKLTA